MPLSYQLARLLISGKASLTDVVNELTKYKMLALLPSIKKALVNLSSHEEGKQIVRIESPFPLSNNAVEVIKKIIGEGTAHHTVTINKNILAGFRARFRGRLYDGSAERIIKQLIHSQ